MELERRDIEEFKAIKSKSRYSIELVNVLYSSQKEISHGELCKALSIKKNHLSNIVKLLNAFNIIFINKIGRNVYYSLTAQGYLYHEYCEQTKPVFNDYVTKRMAMPQPVLALKTRLLSQSDLENKSHKEVPLSTTIND